MKRQDITLNSRYIYLAIRSLMSNENDFYYYTDDLKNRLPKNEADKIIIKGGMLVKGIITIAIHLNEAHISYDGEDDEVFLKLMSEYIKEVPEDYAHYIDGFHLVKEDLLHNREGNSALRKSSMPEISTNSTDTPSDFIPVAYTPESTSEVTPERTVKANRLLRNSGLFIQRSSPSSSPIDMSHTLRPKKSRSVPHKNSDTTQSQSPQRLFAMSSSTLREQLPNPQKVSLLKLKPRKLGFAESEPDLTTQVSTDEYYIENIINRYLGFGRNVNDDTILLLHALVDPVIYQFFQKIADKKVTDTESLMLNSAMNEMKCLSKLKKKKSSQSSPTLRSSITNTDQAGLRRTLLSEVENKISWIFTCFLVTKTLEDPSLLTLIFRSFGHKKIGLIKLIDVNLLIQLLDPHFSPVDHSLFDANEALIRHSEKIGPLYIQFIAHVFAVMEYNPKPGSEEFLKWFRLLISLLKHNPYFPMIFSDSDSSIKFLSSLTSMNMIEFMNEIKRNSLSINLSHAIIHRLIYKKELRLAKLLLRDQAKALSGLVKETGEDHFYFSLLSLKNKTVDLHLLKDSQFIAFIQNHKTLVGRFHYADFLERIKVAFDYSNLPNDGDDGTDVRNTQAGEALLKRGINTLRQTLSNKFLSMSEITELFWNQEIPVNKLGRGEEWLKLYRENLSLILSEFMPHLPRHLDQINELYDKYYNQTIGKLSSMDYSRFNPNDHTLFQFPKIMTQYIMQNLDKVKKFNENIHAMEKIYQEICAFSNGTVRFNSKEQSGFKPITLIADMILEKARTINPRATSFTRENFAAVISLFVTDYCRDNFKSMDDLNGICTQRTLRDISGLEPQTLWLHIELSTTLLKMFEIKIREMTIINSGKLLDDSFTEDIVRSVIYNLMSEIRLMKSSNEFSFLESPSSMGTGYMNL
ncbi:MAG: hypothetical protein K2X50_01715 [Gammaproteobacteria bacterium]|nr:hypothetical protein [Gammaproteobacteria bacterium]